MAELDDIVDSLIALHEVTRRHELQAGEQEYLSRYAQVHLNFWRQAQSRELTLIQPAEIAELRRRVHQLRGLLERSPEDFEHAALDPFAMSVRLFRGLPGGPTIGPPMPPPKPKPVAKPMMEN